MWSSFEVWCGAVDWVAVEVKEDETGKVYV
jgi:hypothetical protein